MSYIPVTQLRKDRKKHRVALKKRRITYTMLVIGVVSFLFFLPVLPQSAVTHDTWLALCTLLLFSGAIVSITIALLMRIRQWLVIKKHAAAQIQSSRRETASSKQGEVVMISDPLLRNSIRRGIESILLISAWAFFLHLMQPFITAFVWWQGYTLLEENVISLAVIEGVLNMIEPSVYFGSITFLILLSWSQWNYWRYGRTKLQQAKPLGSKTDVAVFFDDPFAAVSKAQPVKWSHTGNR